MSAISHRPPEQRLRLDIINVLAKSGLVSKGNLVEEAEKVWEFVSGGDNKNDADPQEQPNGKRSHDKPVDDPLGEILDKVVKAVDDLAGTAGKYLGGLIDDVLNERKKPPGTY